MHDQRWGYSRVIWRIVLGVTLFGMGIFTLGTGYFVAAQGPDVPGLEPITPQNASRLTELVRWGNGKATDAAYSPDGRWLAVAGSLGVWLFDAEHLEREPRYLEGHTSWTMDVAWSPNGALLASVSVDGTLYIWLAATGTPIARRDMHVPLYSVDWSRDGRYIAVGGDQTSVWVWDARQGELVWRFFEEKPHFMGYKPSTEPSKGPPSAGAFLRRRAIDSEPRDAKPIDYGASHPGQPYPPVPQTELRPPIRRVAWSPDSRYLAAGGGCLQCFYLEWHGGFENSLSPIYIWRVEQWRQRGDVTVSGVLDDLAWSPDGQLLAVANGWPDGDVQLWDMTTYESYPSVLNSDDLPRGNVTRVAWSPDGQQLLMVKEGTLWLWDRASDQAKSLSLQVTEYAHLVWSPDGRKVAVVGPADVMQIENTQTWQQRTVTTWFNDSVHDVEWMPDGRSLAVFRRPDEAQLWDGWTGELREVVTFENGERIIPLSAFSPDAQELLTLEAENEQRDRAWLVLWKINWDTATAMKVQEWELFKEDDQTNDKTPNVLKWSPDGRYAALGYGVYGYETARIVLWDMIRGERVATIYPGNLDGGVTHLAWSPDGRYIATGDGWSIGIQDVLSGEDALAIEGAGYEQGEIAWSPDGRYIAVSSKCFYLCTGVACSESDLSVQVFDAKTGELVMEAVGLGRSWRRMVSWSSDGRLLASAERNGRVHLWGADDWEEVAVVNMHHGDVSEMVWSPDGTRIVSASRDGTVRIWGVPARE